MIKRFLFVILLMTTLSLLSLAQKTVVEVPSDNFPNEGNLNQAVAAAIDAGTLSNTIFQLEPYGYYILTGTIVIPAGEHLEIVAPEPGNDQLTSPPQILWTASGGVATDMLFESYGEITFRNLWILYANVAGDQVGTTIQIRPNPNGPERATFENVIFDWSPTPPNAGGAVSNTSEGLIAIFRNCYFKNATDFHLRYYGRALSFPYQARGWHNEYVLFENCTFANIGYVYMQEENNWGSNVHFNHCTFLNTVMFTLQTGWWHKMSVTNSIFVNPFMFGYIPAQLGPSGEMNGSLIRIDSVATFPFTVPFDEQDRRILFANNSHYYEDWLRDWIVNNPYAQRLRDDFREDEIPVLHPPLSPLTLEFLDGTDDDGNMLFPYMNKVNFHDDTDPGFIEAPTNHEDLKDFLRRKWDDNTQNMWAYYPEDGVNQMWPMRENMAYTNETLMSASISGFPLGDLYRWWPEKYAEWEAQKESEWDRILTWLETGVDPDDPVSVREIAGREIPADFVLSQNYPNPFNPMTKIEYSVPIGSDVLLQVFNVLGQEVATLFNGYQEAGNYLTTFDGTGLPSGVYIYRLQSGSTSIAKTFVLTK
jgi:hypothetical protein